MKILYSVAIHGFYLIMLFASLFNSKARQWIYGRRRWRLKSAIPDTGTKTFWFHAASLGEFEQGRPLMEEMRNRIPDCRIVLTFYSPSGYEIRKNYEGADIICYLPLDTHYNARNFIERIKPDAVFFIKYEFWYFYLRQLHQLAIPVYLISGIFRPRHIFFRKYGWFFRQQLGYFSYFFLQDITSCELLHSLGYTNTLITGDTRFDRVVQNVRLVKQIETVWRFCHGQVCLVAGSTWPADEVLLAGYLQHAPETLKFIIAPHEIHPWRIEKLNSQFGHDGILFSCATPETVHEKRVLIIDNIGMLSSLYGYGTMAYIGGGFGKGIHNILEAAVFGLPVFFGPNHYQFKEAVDMVQLHCAFPIHTSAELGVIAGNFLSDRLFLEKTAALSAKYVADNTGASKKIANYILGQ
jgi:3-deoxy-D-manno-octulosonic-acid transferase